jgi:hypothetical protein
LAQERSSAKSEPVLQVHCLIVVQGINQSPAALGLTLSQVLLEGVLFLHTLTLGNQTKSSHEEFSIGSGWHCLLYQQIYTACSDTFLAGDAFTLNFLKTFLDEDSQVDDHFVGGSLRLKVLEHDSGAEQGDCLVNYVDFIFSLGCRAR